MCGSGVCSSPLVLVVRRCESVRELCCTCECMVMQMLPSDGVFPR